ncbi:hypothetical protein Tco_0144015 [Tanacetum coccineum]
MSQITGLRKAFFTSTDDWGNHGIQQGLKTSLDILAFARSKPYGECGVGTWLRGFGWLGGGEQGIGIVGPMGWTRGMGWWFRSMGWCGVKRVVVVVGPASMSNGLNGNCCWATVKWAGMEVVVVSLRAKWKLLFIKVDVTGNNDFVVDEVQGTVYPRCRAGGLQVSKLKVDVVDGSLSDRVEIAIERAVVDLSQWSRSRRVWCNKDMMKVEGILYMLGLLKGSEHSCVELAQGERMAPVSIFQAGFLKCSLSEMQEASYWGCQNLVGHSARIEVVGPAEIIGLTETDGPARDVGPAEKDREWRSRGWWVFMPDTCNGIALSIGGSVGGVGVLMHDIMKATYPTIAERIHGDRISDSTIPIVTGFLGECSKRCALAPQRRRQGGRRSLAVTIWTLSLALGVA